MSEADEYQLLMRARTYLRLAVRDALALAEYRGVTVKGLIEEISTIRDELDERLHSVGK